jgi:hypothetical protein
MKLIALITAVAVLATAAVAGAQAPLREYEGRVVSVNRDAKRFRLHDAERGTVRINVNRNTRWERINGPRPAGGHATRGGQGPPRERPLGRGRGRAVWRRGEHGGRNP